MGALLESVLLYAAAAVMIGITPALIIAAIVSVYREHEDDR